MATQFYETDEPHASASGLLKKKLPKIFKEARSILALAIPIILTAMLNYSRAIVSMLFLGKLGDDELAAGALAIAFANITGNSVLSGLAQGMEPLCAQAFGAKTLKSISVTLHRAIVILLVCAVPISVLWINMSRILLLLRQDHHITPMAQTYLFFLLPDLFTQCFIHPIRIYLRSQGITYPLAIATVWGTVLQLPANLFLVSHHGCGVGGVAVGMAVSNMFVLFVLVGYVWVKGLHEPTWTAPSRECLTGWKPLLKLAAPSVVSVCLEWWWYEIALVLCGIMVSPKATVASMGILIQITSFLYIFPSSLSMAASTRVGNELGAERPNKAKMSAGLSVFLSAVMGIFAMSIAVGLKDVWARMFTKDTHILHLTSAALPILGLCELGNCPQTIMAGVLRGTARTGQAAYVNFGAFYLVGMPVAVGLGFRTGFGFRGLWIGLLCAQVTCCGLMMYVVSATDWNGEAKRAKLLTCLETRSQPLVLESNETETCQDLVGIKVTVE